MLIIATQSPFSKALPPVQQGAALILTQDAVIAVTLPDVLAGCSAVYALKSDIEARGLIDHSSPNIQVIDLAEFVKLTAKHKPLVNW
ncbi:sulfurtransferase complex subunit TusB [Psychrobium sp. nBUS_13]|uniref:sulfurtransferase complex subunit TusB n=1 Tax=Psychrobium sp. nBUS_13 TaxID=3395319 RepID=UPI003EB85B8A